MGFPARSFLRDLFACSRNLLSGLLLVAWIVFLPSYAFGAEPHAAPTLLGIRVEFILFSLALVGVALFHRHTMYVALTGLVCIVIFKYLFIDGFSFFGHLFGHGTKRESGEFCSI